MLKIAYLNFIGGVIGFIIYFVIFTNKGFDTYNEAIIYLATWSILAGVCGSIFAVTLYKKGIRMEKIILGFMVLSGLLFGGDKIEINAPTVMCYNKNPEHGKFTLMAILAEDDVISIDFGNVL